MSTVHGFQHNMGILEEDPGEKYLVLVKIDKLLK